MKGTLFLQGSLGGLNAREGRPLFMEAVGERPLLGLLLDEATASGCFDRVVFVTSAEACDDPVADSLAGTWPGVVVHRVPGDSPHALGPAHRQVHLLWSANCGGVLSIDGFREIAPQYVQDASQAVFALDVEDAPIVSAQYFRKAAPAASQIGFFGTIGPGGASVCGFQMRALEKMSNHQRSLRVAAAATVRDRVGRAIQAIRRERALETDDEIAAVSAWQQATADRQEVSPGGSLVSMTRDYVSRHSDAPTREQLLRELAAEAMSVTTGSGLEMVRSAHELPSPGDVGAIERWLARYEQRDFQRLGQQRFYPDYPSYLEVELTSRCNLACQFCPQTRLTRPTANLDYDTFEALLNRVGDAVTLLNFSGFGEPTLHPRLFDFVRLAKSRGIPRVEIETNGTRLGDEAFLQELFESGLDILAVNLDALDQAGEIPFGSVYGLVKTFMERRGEAPRPFLVLQRTNMAVPGQDAAIERDFTLWFDVADAFAIKPFNTYRGTFPEKRPIDFAPIERTVCRKLLASALVLSSGEPVMCEQCFDRQSAGADVLSPTGESVTLRRLRGNHDRGHFGAWCEPCTQWYQQDVPWPLPEGQRRWFDSALARAAGRVSERLLASKAEAVAATHIPEIVARSGDHDELRGRLEQMVGRERWAEAVPDELPAPCGRIGSDEPADGVLVHPVSCAVLGETLYVTDPGARRISAHSLDGEFQFAFGETGEYDERYHECPDIAAADGELYVAEPNRIRRYTPDGELLGTLAPDWDGPPPFSIAPGPPGHLWVATEQDRVILLDVGSGDVVRSLDDPSWLKVLVSASPETGELFVASPDRHEVFVYDIEGNPKDRIGRDRLARLHWPVHVAAFGTGYAVSNPGGLEVLILSSEFEYVGSLPVPAWAGKVARAGGRLYVMTRGSETACRVWELERVPAAPA